MLQISNYWLEIYLNSVSTFKFKFKSHILNIKNGKIGQIMDMFFFGTPYRDVQKWSPRTRLFRRIASRYIFEQSTTYSAFVKSGAGKDLVAGDL